MVTKRLAQRKRQLQRRRIAQLTRAIERLSADLSALEDDMNSAIGGLDIELRDTHSRIDDLEAQE